MPDPEDTPQGTDEDNGGTRGRRTEETKRPHYLHYWGFPGDTVAGDRVPGAGGLGLIPGQGTRSHVPQLNLAQLN